jgi:predicted O-methyltransferase YrrM
MEKARRALLDELAAFGREHDAARADRRERLRNVEPETAAMLAVLVRACGARRLLEIGTSNGYSTIWLGDAAEELGGTLLSVDLDTGRAAQAVENVARAGLQGNVELRIQDAAVTLAGLPGGSVDFVFLDAERPAYVDYWQDLVRVLARPGLLAVDNAVSHAGEIAAFRELAESDARVAVALVPVGAGLLLIAPRA